MPQAMLPGLLHPEPLALCQATTYPSPPVREIELLTPPFTAEQTGKSLEHVTLPKVHAMVRRHNYS